MKSSCFGVGCVLSTDAEPLSDNAQQVYSLSHGSRTMQARREMQFILLKLTSQTSRPRPLPTDQEPGVRTQLIELFRVDRRGCERLAVRSANRRLRRP